MIWQRTSERPNERVAVTVSKDTMSAFMLLRSPQEGDGPITFEEVIGELKGAEVVFGVDENAVRRAVDEKTYNTPIPVAAGRPPERGIHSTFAYTFDTSDQHKPKEGSDGHIGAGHQDVPDLRHAGDERQG
jgi:uncharacterized protein